MWGGGNLAAARRAGRYGLGMLANGRRARHAGGVRGGLPRQHGHEPGPDLLPDRGHPPRRASSPTTSTRAWDEIGEYLLHDARMLRGVEPGQRDLGGHLSA